MKSLSVKLVKLGLALAILVILGLPITELWKMLVLLATWITVAFGTPRLRLRRCAVALAIVIGTLLLLRVLPAAAIEEGHNIFLVTDTEIALRDGLPSAVYEPWQRAFNARYPADVDQGAAWRLAALPTVFTVSSDALWQPAKYSRRVDRIDFQNLSEFRAGFSNDVRYNFYGNDALSLGRGFRADLPYFVMYEFSRASIGSTLHWKGTVFWEGTGDTFEELVHAENAGRLIAEADVGKRAYALHLPPPIGERFWEKGRAASETAASTTLSMYLELGPALAAGRVLGQVLRVAAIIGILALTVTSLGRRYLMALSVVTAGLLIVALTIHFSEGKYLGATYPPHGGGDDGLSHESMGRSMAQLVMAGEWAEGLRGGQSVYWDTPGMRYARAFEKMMFGDTNLGYAAFVGLLPLFVYLLLRHVADERWAIAGVAFFLCAPVGSLSFLQYIQYAKLGYAEAMAFGFLILGVNLFMRSEPAWGGRRDAIDTFFGGVCLAGSMFLRPNLAIVVPVLGLFVLLAAWKRRDITVGMAAILGLAFALWMPLHNYLYGRVFVLISSSAGSFAVPLSPLTYLRAVEELVTGNRLSGQLALATTQVSGWLWTLPRLPIASLKPIAEAFMALKLFSLALTFYAVYRYRRVGGPILMLACAALATHLPMLFVVAGNSFRYAMIGWDLSALLTIAMVYDFRNVRNVSLLSRNSTNQAV